MLIIALLIYTPVFAFELPLNNGVCHARFADGLDGCPFELHARAEWELGKRALTPISPNIRRTRQDIDRRRSRRASRRRSQGRWEEQRQLAQAIGDQPRGRYVQGLLGEVSFAQSLLNSCDLGTHGLYMRENACALIPWQTLEVVGFEEDITLYVSLPTPSSSYEIACVLGNMIPLTQRAACPIEVVKGWGIVSLGHCNDSRRRITLAVVLNKVLNFQSLKNKRLSGTLMLLLWWWLRKLKTQSTQKVRAGEPQESGQGGRRQDHRRFGA